MFKNKNLFVLKISCYKSRPNASDNAVLIVNRNESKEGEERGPVKEIIDFILAIQNISIEF